MTRSRQKPYSQKPRSWGRNFLAILVACSAAGAAHVNNDPLSIGGSPSARAASTSAPTMSIPPSPQMPSKIDGKTPHSEHDANIHDPQVLRGIWALKMVCSLMEKGSQAFEKVPDYTTNLFKQERVNGILADGQTIDTKIRHQPFSVYMKWLSGDRGRQVIYVDGQNDGNILVQPGGIKGRLTGVLALEPEGALALSDSRYPIQKAGLLALAKTILEHEKKDIERGTGFQCELRDDQMFEDRPCYLFTCVYDSPEINQRYRKAIIFVDKELSMPVCVKNYTWVRDANPETLDEESLVEFYAYTDMKISQKLADADFDQTNSDYKLRVKQ